MDECEPLITGMSAGDSFGELALQEDNGKRSVTMRTEIATVLVVLSKRNYLRTIKNMFELETRDRVDFLCRVGPGPHCLLIVCPFCKQRAPRHTPRVNPRLLEPLRWRNACSSGLVDIARHVIG